MNILITKIERLTVLNKILLSFVFLITTTALTLYLEYQIPKSFIKDLGVFYVSILGVFSCYYFGKFSVIMLMNDTITIKGKISRVNSNKNGEL